MAAADERQDARATLEFLREEESASGRSARLHLVLAPACSGIPAAKRALSPGARTTRSPCATGSSAGSGARLIRLRRLERLAKLGGRIREYSGCQEPEVSRASRGPADDSSRAHANPYADELEVHVDRLPWAQEPQRVADDRRRTDGAAVAPADQKEERGALTALR